MNKLLYLLKVLENKMGYFDVLNESVSKASVGWHIEHSLLTINVIIDTLLKSNPAHYKSKFSLVKFIVLTFHKIPRGRAQSPGAVRPLENFTVENTKNSFQRCYELLKSIPTLSENNYFKHPIFGHLNLKPAINFLGIHTKHHLDIINDILKAGKN